MGGEKSSQGESGRIVKIGVVVSLVLLAGVSGYFLGMAQSDERADNSDSTSELTTVLPSSPVVSALTFVVFEEENSTTNELMQFMHIQGQVVNEAPFMVRGCLELRVYYSYQRNGVDSTGYYSFDLAEIWMTHQVMVGVIEVPANESQQVDWLFEAQRVPSNEWWRLIQAENATFFYGFPAYRLDEHTRVHPCFVVSEDYTPAPTPEFTSEFSITILNEWPEPTPGALILVRGSVYNDGLVQGSCVLRWQFNDSREWTDEDQKFDVDALESNSVEKWYGHPWYGIIDEADIEIDDASIRLNHWVITLW